jgi:hypothetical protein
MNMWNHHTVSTLTEELIDVSTCDGVEIKLDDLDTKSAAIVVVPPTSWISNVDELAPDGLEITFSTPHAEVTLVLTNLNELDLHNALDIHLRDMEEQ